MENRRPLTPLRAYTSQKTRQIELKDYGTKVKVTAEDLHGALYK